MNLQETWSVKWACLASSCGPVQHGINDIWGRKSLSNRSPTINILRICSNERNSRWIKWVKVFWDGSSSLPMNWLCHHNQGLINHLDCTFFYSPRGNWTHFCINIHVFLGMFSIYEWNTILNRFAVRVDVLFCNYSGKSLGDFSSILLYCSNHGLNPVVFLSVPLEWSLRFMSLSQELGTVSPVSSQRYTVLAGA